MQRHAIAWRQKSKSDWQEWIGQLFERNYFPLFVDSLLNNLSVKQWKLSHYIIIWTIYLLI